MRAFPPCCHWFRIMSTVQRFPDIMGYNCYIVAIGYRSILIHCCNWISVKLVTFLLLCWPKVAQSCYIVLQSFSTMRIQDNLRMWNMCWFGWFFGLWDFREFHSPTRFVSFGTFLVLIFKRKQWRSKIWFFKALVFIWIILTLCTAYFWSQKLTIKITSTWCTCICNRKRRHMILNKFWISRSLSSGATSVLTAWHFLAR